MNRVVVTGLGVISAAGHNAAEFWKSVSAGQSSIGDITTIPTDLLTIAIGAEVKDYEPTDHFSAKELGLLDRFSQFGLVAAREAIAESGISFEGERGERTATIIGSGVGGQATLDGAYWTIYAEKKTRLHPFTIPRLMINAAPSQITMEHGITGPAYSLASACSSATHAIGHAFHMVRSGMMDAAVTGGAEATITVGTMKGWEALRVMATDTCRPFSKDRTGMVLGEGAAIFVLETLENAQARGANIYAEICGLGMSSDAMDITLPDPKGAARAITGALKDGGLNPEDIDYVNAHGTGTAANDVSETKALKLAFGDHAKKLAVSSSKSMFGHALGGAGALELAVTILGIRDGIAAPTANYNEPDPECDLDYVPNEAREMKIGAAISNSFAFGGLNAVVAVKAFEG
ncbi:MAG: beta-ketoacyl-[acyl-carrier-protein] synthase family protein [Alphaproteobacteria bacterium]|jgi:nodulation protein E|nr:beta-ketoacyl-[acyl-carrier-protein] synthase family protein [Alphaproteobacteria bacterium]